MLPTSPEFSAMIAAREGAAGVEWLSRLPGTVDTLLQTWELHPQGPTLYGTCAVVVPVRTADGGQAALKVGLIDDETRGEPAALRAWAGNGAVRLLRADEPHGALLLERLDERRTPLHLPVQQALDVATDLVAELRAPAVAGLRLASDTAGRWSTELFDDWQRLGRPCGEPLLRSALEVCQELSVPVAEPSIVHGDLHDANILGRGPDGWAAIDPKPLAGDPASEVVPLLRNRWSQIRGDDPTDASVGRRVRRFAERAGLDLDAAYRWCLVRSVDDALWFQDTGQPERAEISWDMARCMLTLRRPHR
ncbi:MAG TPA: aminoglycoside phosphotransferase family protein [Cellulomonas sp.]